MSLIDTPSALIIPVDRIYNLSTIQDHHLVCHKGFTSDSKYSNVKYKATSIGPTSIETVVDGHLCHLKEYYVTCSESFFGVKTIESGVNTIPVSVSECIDAIDMYDSDLLDDNTDVLQNCGWMNTETSSKKVYSIVKKQIQLDTYTGKFKDPLLFNGECDDLGCKTIYDNMWWITKSSPNQYCPKTESNIMHVYIPEDLNPKSIIFSSNYIPDVPLAGACGPYSYCGSTGFVLSTGHFVLMSNEIPNRIIPEIKKLPACKSDVKLIDNSLHSYVLGSLLSVETLFMLDRCESVLRKIRSHQNLSLFELGFLNPHHGGNGLGYQVIEGKVLVGKYAYYEADNIEVDCYSCSSCNINIKRANGIIKVESDVMYCPCKNFKGCYLPNGFTAYKNKLINPLSELEEDIDDKYMEETLDPIYIPHIANDVHTTLSITGYHNHPNSTSNNFFNVLQEDAKLIKDWILMAFIWIISGVIVILIIYIGSNILIAYIRSKKGYKPKDFPSTGVELLPRVAHDSPFV